METSIFVTLHARDGHELGLWELVEMLKDRRRSLIVLPRPFDLMPAAIASLLLEKGIAADTPCTPCSGSLSLARELTSTLSRRWRRRAMSSVISQSRYFP